MVRVSYRNRREGYLADRLTMYSMNYIFNESFSQSSLYKIILGEFNIDLDYIYDKCEENRISFESTFVKISKELFIKANPFIKNKIIYKFIHNLGLEINTLIDQIQTNIKEFIPVDDVMVDDNIERSYQIIKNRFHQTLLNYERNSDNGSHDFNSIEFKLLRIIDDFYFNHMESLSFLLPFVTDTFNNVIKNCYRIEFNKSNKIFNNFLNDSSSYSRRINNTYTTNTSLNSFILNSITSETSTYITDYNRINSFNNTQPEYDFIQNFKKLLPKKESINKNTPGVKILNKSLKIIRKFFPKEKLNLFLKEIEVIIPGEFFNWGFKLRSRKDLIRYSESLENFSINWDLYIYHKKLDERIARSCITFPGSPILDQVLSVYLMIQSGKEIEILKNSGFFDKNSVLFKSIISPMLEQNKNIIEDNFTLDGTNRYQNLLRSNFLRRSISEVEIKNLIKTWLKDYFFKLGMDPELWNYSTNLDVSFEEAIDYEAFQLFDVKVFDKWVKPFKWSKDCFRFKNLLLLENNILNQNHKVSVIKL